MPARKRRLSEDSPPTRTKKPATVADRDDEDDLPFILAQIRAQEESEELARKLQDEWDASVSGPSSSGAPSQSSGGASRSHSYFTPENVIEASDGEEDDEAMARRLAREWGTENVMLDVQPTDVRPSEPSSSVLVDQDEEVPGAISHDQLPLVSKIEEHRDVFTGEKTCSCGARLPSPRGHVRVLLPLSH